MDTNSALSGGGIVSLAVLFFGVVYKAVNHRRVRSNCCGKEVSASFDVEETTPPNKDLNIKVPAEKV